MPDVDRRAVLGEQPLDDLDRTVDARTERTRRGQQHALHASASRLLSARRAPNDRAQRHERLAREAAQEADRVDAAVRRRAPRDAAEPPRRRVADRAQAADEPAAACERARLHVDGLRPGLLVQPCTLRRVVDDARRTEDRPRARRAQRRAAHLPTAPHPTRRRRASRRSPCRPADPARARPRSRTTPAGPRAHRATHRARRAPSARAVARCAPRRVIAQANVSPSASKPCSGRCP